MTILILFFSLALIVSFFCSLMEAVMLSVTPAYIETLIDSDRASGTILQDLNRQIDRPLAAILTLNTFANTVGAAGVGVQAARLWGNLGMGIASALLTLSILMFSEIVPKTLGVVHCKALAPVVAYSVRGLIIAIYPIVLLLELVSKSLSDRRVQSTISREEVIAAAAIGHSEGELHKQEHRVIRNILQLDKVRAKDVLTPRSVLVAFCQDETVGHIIKQHSPIRFSRIPVYGKDLDEITGVVNRYKLLQAYSKGLGESRVGSLVMPIHPVPDTKSVASTLDEFIQRREHIFLVVDEYGGTAGIITLEDAIETLLGVEIVDESDSVEDMRKLATQIWEQRKQEHQL